MEFILISQFIDDELTLDEKEGFVKGVRHDAAFYDETLDLLAQERLLRRLDIAPPPDVVPLPAPRRKSPWRPALAIAASLLVLALSLVTLMPERDRRVTHRFLLHAPQVGAVAVMGDFTAWSPVSLLPVGAEGYWEVTLEIPEGVHRYAFLIDGEALALDPTVVARERDDFGGVNSILTIGGEEV